MPKKTGYKKKRSSKRAISKIEPAVTTLSYELVSSTVGAPNFIDIMADLSNINRRLYRQGMQVAIGGITFTDDLTPPGGQSRGLDISVLTAGNTWIVHNAWKKAQALWMQMQKEVLDSNPSVAGKWRDFKVLLAEDMSFASNVRRARDGTASAWPAGQEWSRSTFVVPQHDVDPITGEVLAAEEWTACLVGPDDTANKIFSLVKAYEESRATVNTSVPNVPGNLPTSFYLQLQDDGSQDPELASVIESENDQPPYAMAAGTYPGGEAFGAGGALTRVNRIVMNENTPTGQVPGFVAECGLMKVVVKSSTGSDNIRMQIHLVPGEYKGIMAVPMGQ
jgi:hypothetical protein